MYQPIEHYSSEIVIDVEVWPRRLNMRFIDIAIEPVQYRDARLRTSGLHGTCHSEDAQLTAQRIGMFQSQRTTMIVRIVPAFAASSKVIKKNEEVGRSRESRFRSRK